MIDVIDAPTNLSIRKGGWGGDKLFLPRKRWHSLHAIHHGMGRVDQSRRKREKDMKLELKVMSALY